MEGKIAEKDVKAPNLIERAKEEIEAVIHTEQTHNRETHGMNNDIDEDTPIDQVKAPNVFERAKDEIDALVETIHPKKNDDCEQPKKEGGFWSFVGRWSERCCSPNGKRD